VQANAISGQDACAQIISGFNWDEQTAPFSANADRVFRI
jgi:hypothetical protein